MPKKELMSPCPICDKVVRDETLTQHILDHEPEERNMKCPCCEDRIPMFEMMEHLETHSLSSEYSVQEDDDDDVVRDPDFHPEDIADQPSSPNSLQPSEPSSPVTEPPEPAGTFNIMRFTPLTAPEKGTEQSKGIKRKKTETVQVKNMKGNILTIAKGKRRKSYKKRDMTKNLPRRKGKQQRKRRRCPFCVLEVINLLRHLIKVHEFTREGGLNCIKDSKYQITGTMPKRRLFVCPVLGCKAKVQWLQQHLKQVHAMGITAVATTMENARHASSDEETPKKPRQFIPIIPAWSDSEFESEDELPLAIIQERARSEFQTLNPDAVTSEKTDETTAGNSNSEEPYESNIETTLNPNDDTNTIDDEEEPQFDVPYSEIPILKTFYNYLVSIDCGKNPTAAEAYCKKVFSIWKSVEDGCKEVDSTLDVDSIRDLWLNKSKFSASTKLTYIGALRQFWNFLRTLDEMTNKHHKITKAMTKTAAWNKTLGTEKRIRSDEYTLQETETLLNPEDFKSFAASDTVMEIKEMFNNLQNNQIPKTLPEQCRMRNYLLLLLLLYNGQRSGAVMGMTIRGFEYAKKGVGGYVISVTKHKTAKSFGAVTLYVPEDLYRMLELYVKYLRPLVANFDPQIHNDLQAEVFLSSTGSPMTQSLINHAIQGIWVQSMRERVSHNVSATRLRRSVVTHCRNADPSCRDSLAKQMTHAPTTADKYYLVIEKSKNAEKVTEMIKSVMVGLKKQQTQMELEQTQRTDTEKDLLETEKHSQMELDTTEMTLTKNTAEGETQAHRTETHTGTSGVLSPQDSISSLANKGTGETRRRTITLRPGTSSAQIMASTDFAIPESSRRAFSPVDSEAIVRLAQELINDRERPITSVTVLDILNRTKPGRDIVRRYAKVYGDLIVAKKLADRVRSARRTQRKAASEITKQK